MTETTNDDEPIGNEAGIDGAERDETADEQSRADEQRHRERDLRRDQQRAEAAASGGRCVEPRSLSRSAAVRFGRESLQRRHQAEQRSP